MNDIKITFDEELTYEGITFEKKAVYGLPKKGQYYFDDSKVVKLSEMDFISLNYPVLTPKKKIYTVIKVEGDYSSENPNKIENLLDVVVKLYTSPISGTVQVVEE